MSEAPAPVDRTAAALARLAELDLAAVEHVHARLLAATEAAEVAELGRTYQRVARSLRQTLAFGERHARERAAAAETAAKAALARREARRDALPEDLVNARFEIVGDAMNRVIYTVCAERPDWIEDLEVRLDRELTQLFNDDRILDDDIDAQVRAISLALGLPPELAARWRSLPDPVFHGPHANVPRVPSAPAAPAPSDADTS